MSEFIQGELFVFESGFRLQYGEALNHNFETLANRTLTGQVQKAILEIFPSHPPALWGDFVTQYVGDPTGTDGTYQTVFVTAFAPSLGAFWQLLRTYLIVGCGLSTTASDDLLAAIWRLADALPL